MSVILRDAKARDRAKFVSEAARAFGVEQARLAHEAITSELGEHVGRKFPVPISLAVRISGWSEKWIRRNLKIIEAEGQHDAIQFGDLIDAMEQRKNK